MKKEKFWHLLFLAAVFFKGLDGILELCGGILLLFLSNTSLIKYVNFIFNHLLTGKETDPVFMYLSNYTHVSHNTQLFAGAYLLGHGIIKIIIVIGLLLRKLMIYPVAVLILICFILYQLYRFAHTHSILLFFLTMLDIVLIFLIYEEYKRLKRINLL